MKTFTLSEIKKLELSIEFISRLTMKGDGIRVVDDDGNYLDAETGLLSRLADINAERAEILEKFKVNESDSENVRHFAKNIV